MMGESPDGHLRRLRGAAAVERDPVEEAIEHHEKSARYYRVLQEMWIQCSDKISTTEIIC